MKRLFIFMMVVAFCLGAFALHAENQKEPEKKPAPPESARLFI